MIISSTDLFGQPNSALSGSKNAAADGSRQECYSIAAQSFSSIPRLSGSRQAQIGSIYFGRGGSSDDGVVDASTKLGVSPDDHAAFLNGELTQFPTKGGDPAIGFLQCNDDGLVSQLFSINNQVGGAPAAFQQFYSGSMQSYAVQTPFRGRF